uniref:tetratricopeptide repeat protein 8-like n=1 Tax=Styela clava TaxID=7725 RepID=UPI001939998C|nr:tetratricopeptide repeat protein 8-like [Styela clava]XP_039250373.1 tetratricopeptide repeat protein 8-like [Styela clava]XP_039250382.1 tetratricopeptide repeat protein 8-like [Styela clava]XP_039255326.1 tetratricopeptide repeat protein 8-like [Styela clava]XP_039255327.1 tetratricopeptide repeat protein 8-like [Styela clava]
MDPMFMALSYFRRRKYDECANLCTKMLEKNPYDQAVWSLKTRALTEQVYIDEVEAEEVGIAEVIMDDNAVAQVARPGTSMKPSSSGRSTGTSPAVRPTSQSGRPVSGFVRPGTQSGRPGTMEQALRTPRSAQTARPVTSASGRFVRLGTASMLSNKDGPFINMSRLNLNKYAGRDNLSKALFEYIFHHENDVRNALELAALATEKSQYKDWWWKVQLGKCYYRLGMYRDAERQFKSALKQESIVDTMLYLGKVYQRLDQPLSAIDIYNQGLEKYPGEASLLTGVARVYDAMDNQEEMAKWYRHVLDHDRTNVEALASIAADYFYNDHPEVALSLYRRLLQMGVYNVQIFNNLGLCCYYAQQYDMTFKCFERALLVAEDLEAADVWYNVSHVAIGIGELNMAYQCLRLAVSIDNSHAEAYNNLGVLELRQGDIDKAKVFFTSSQELAPGSYEAHYNQATLSQSLGDLQTTYISTMRATEAFPEHVDSKDLLKVLKDHFTSL